MGLWWSCHVAGIMRTSGLSYYAQIQLDQERRRSNHPGWGILRLTVFGCHRKVADYESRVAPSFSETVKLSWTDY